MTIADAAATLGGGAAAVAGAIYLGRRLVRFLRMLDKLAGLITRELEHNGGSSLRDDVHAIAVHTGRLEADFSEMNLRVETLESLELLGYRAPRDRPK